MISALQGDQRRCRALSCRNIEIMGHPDKPGDDDQREDD
jgi:hypothetical protein